MIDDSPLHTLWSKAVGQPDYVKAEWLALEKKLHAELSGTMPAWVRRAAMRLYPPLGLNQDFNAGHRAMAEIIINEERRKG